MDPIYEEPIQAFLDKHDSSVQSGYVLFGAPLDLTTSYRRGTRFAPNSIRQTSRYIETYSIRTGLSWNDLRLKDIGNMTLSDNLFDSLEMIEKGIKNIGATSEIPVMIGGEHTITYAAIEAIRPELLIVFDAHLDLRDKLFGEELCHATYLRRILEKHDFELIIIGARAFSLEELSYANSEDRVSIIKANELCDVERVNQVIEAVKKVDSVYLSFDMDVVNPCEASAVGNPSPEGPSVSVILDFINKVCNKKFSGFDLNEVTPLYDNGLTSIQAAHIILETLYSMQKDRT